MKVKVSEASGVVLDWVVAKCEGVVSNDIDDFCLSVKGEYAYSTDWAHGGPIIERERISFLDNGDSWSAFYSRGAKVGQRWTGPTPLIAAMRCYVAGTLGEEVEVPDELA